MLVRFDQTGRSIEICDFPQPDYEGQYFEVPVGMTAPVMFLENGSVRAATDEELEAMAARAANDAAADAARIVRNRLLRVSDVLALADRWAGYTAAQKTAITAYRQALRDLPLQASFPHDITWPNEPAL